ncbi:MAG: hypothetical protein V8Q88_00415 [Christensenellales bacterium]
MEEVRTIRFEDGSLNEMYEDKGGNKKTVSIFVRKARKCSGMSIAAIKGL